jgi:hypothetical protein
MPTDAELAVGARQATPPTNAAGRAPSPAQVRALWVPFALFILLSLADTVSSVVMLRKGMMEEANPLMRWVWQAGGAVGFAAVKTVLILVPLAIFNALKVRRYWFIRHIVWVTVLGYALIYGVFFYLGNC